MIIARQKTEEKLEAEAEKIAEIICETILDQRSELFKRVAVNLRLHTKGYTATLFDWVSNQS